MPDIRQMLGTAAGDRYIANPNNSQALYEALVGPSTPRKRELPPGAIPAPQEGPPQLKHVVSERVIEHEVYNSRQHGRGIGYPSCSRALARVAKVCYDNNGYYRYLGLQPTATSAEIRRALATRYRRYHPDTAGWTRNTEEFMYLREIAKVLLNARRRERYDNLPKGEKWMDSRVRKEVENLTGQTDSAIVMEYVKGPVDLQEEATWETFKGSFKRVRPDEETVKAIETSGPPTRADRQQAMREQAATGGYDYFACPWQPGDWELAQQWYDALVTVAPIFGFTRPMRVWLQDDIEPTWSDMGGILKIPRCWPAATATAFALFSVLNVR